MLAGTAESHSALRPWRAAAVSVKQPDSVIGLLFMWARGLGCTQNRWVLRGVKRKLGRGHPPKWGAAREEGAGRSRMVQPGWRQRTKV